PFALVGTHRRGKRAPQRVLLIARRYVHVASAEHAVRGKVSRERRDVPVGRGRIGGERDFLAAAVRVDDQAELALLGGGERAERCELGGEVEKQIAGGALHRRDHVIEGMGRGYVALDAAARRQ